MKVIPIVLILKLCLKKNKSQEIPENWPLGVRFVSGLNWKPNRRYYRRTHRLSAQMQQKIREELGYQYIMPDVIIKKITDISHPCYNEYGLFAKRNIPKYTYIGTYGGVVIKSVSAVMHSFDYFVQFPEKTECFIDAKYEGNEARFINDYRGTGKDDNVVFMPARAKQVGEVFIAVVAVADIVEGEEILVDYGTAYWDAKRSQ